MGRRGGTARDGPSCGQQVSPMAGKEAGSSCSRVCLARSPSCSPEQHPDIVGRSLVSATGGGVAWMTRSACGTPEGGVRAWLTSQQ